MERLFNLDPQLIHDAVLLAINVFVLFTLLSFILFEPVRKILQDRKDKIKKDNEDAENLKADAIKLKEEYVSKLSGADKQVDQILADARKKALNTENKIVEDAKSEAVRITNRAHAEAELEKKRIEDDVKKEIIGVASEMAKKVAASNISDADKEKILDQTLDEIGDKTWLN